MENVMKIIKSLKDCGLFIKCAFKKMENEAKIQRGRYLGMLLDTLGASLLGNMMAAEEIVRAG